MKVADGRTADRYGVVWPEGYEVCDECGQPDNCGDCDHTRLSADDVLVMIGNLLNGRRPY